MMNDVKKIDHDEIFRENIQNRSILDVVEAFTETNITTMYSMLITKPSNIGFSALSNIDFLFVLVEYENTRFYQVFYWKIRIYTIFLL